MNIVLSVGALLGLLSLVVSATISHSVQVVDSAVVDAILGQLRLHAVVVTAIGLMLWCPLPKLIRARLQLSAWVLIIGVVLFSASLPLSDWLGIAALTKLMPLGGISMMLGWVLLMWAALGGYKPSVIEPKHGIEPKHERTFAGQSKRSAL